MSTTIRAGLKDSDVTISYLDWEEPEEFVEFVLNELDETTISWRDEASLGEKTEKLLLKELKERKRQRKERRG